MYVLVRSRVMLAASLLLSGCYVGFELEEEASTSGSAGATGDAVTTGADPTGDATSGDPSAGSSQSGGASQTGADDDVGTGGETTSGETSGAPVTTDPMTTDPVTTDPVTGDPGTGDPSTTTEGGDETTGDGDSGMMNPVDVPDNAYCADVAGSSAAWAQLEQDILVIVNQKRSEGANCGSKGAFGPAGPLTMDPALRCAARKHSADMAARNFFDHVNPDGELPWDRMGKAGYGSYSAAGENIAAGSADAQGTMGQWMGSDGHCANIMNPSFQHIGVGYSTGGEYGHLWTQVFGAK